MRLQNSFTVPSDPAHVWPLLLDVPAIAPCLPGAELTEVAGERAYKGRARVRIGPVVLTFAGTAEIVDIDGAARRARLRAKGADEKGRGSAEADVDFAIEPDGAGTRVSVVTDLNLVGAVAQYGRASGLIQGIAAEITGQFAKNFEALIREREAAASAADPAAGDAAAGAPALPPAARPVSGLALLWRGLMRTVRAWLAGLSERFARGNEKR